MTQQRNSGIDFLRIISMYMVCILHIINFAIFSGNKPFIGDTNLLPISLLYYMCFSAVNCFALISGYVGIKSNFTYKKFYKNYLPVVFYSLGITIFFCFFHHDAISFYDWLNAIFPIFRTQYWYFTAYAFLCLFIPELNQLILKTSKIHLQRMIWVGIFVFSVLDIIPIFQAYNQIIFKSGFNGFWLCWLYIIGGFISKYGFSELIPNFIKPIRKHFISHKNIFLLSLYFFLSLTSSLLPLITGTLFRYLFNKNIQYTITGYVNILVLSQSLILIYLFSQMTFSLKSKQILQFLCPMAFSVYLIHTHPLVYRFFFVGALSNFSTYSPLLIFLGVIFLSLGLYLICSLIDLCRITFFRYLSISYNRYLKK